VTETPSTTLVISDGGLPAVLAAAMEAERRLAGGGGEVLLMPWPTSREAAAEQGAAVAALARFLSLEIADPCLEPPTRELEPGMRESLSLLTALHTGRPRGCARIIWPVQHHNDDASIAGDLDRIAAAVDRAQLVGRLGLLDTRPGDVPPRFETPLADLTDAQVADLVLDLDAPVHLAWWWRTLAGRRAESLAAAERRAWLPVLRDAGWIEAGPSPPSRVPAEPVEPIAD